MAMRVHIVMFAGLRIWKRPGSIGIVHNAIGINAINVFIQYQAGARTATHL